MEYSGLLGPYKVNRPLTDAERGRQLHQKMKLDVAPAYQLSVIRMNSTFMEVVDKYFAWKGFLSMFCLVVIIIFGGALLAFILASAIESGGLAKDWGFLLGVAAMAIPVVWFFTRQLRKECFAYTHYPIRLNRKTRRVHVFRMNGTVLSVPWDEVFFCIGELPRNMWEIQGHVLDTDGVTVRETFAFFQLGSGEGDVPVIKQFWEFNRRYMEEGSQAVCELVKVCLPIATQRESFWFGFHFMHSEASGMSSLVVLLLGVLALIVSPFRWLAMRTSKIPVWPKEIDDQCIIEPNDPYLREASMNPERMT